MTPWRVFVEQAKDLASTMASSAGDREISPVLQLETPLATWAHIIDPGFFAADTPTPFVELVVRLVTIQRATRVAWCFSAPLVARLIDGTVDTTPALCVSCIDREVEETWTAQLIPVANDLRLLGPWTAWPTGETVSLILQPIQDAMRTA